MDLDLYSDELFAIQIDMYLFEKAIDADTPQEIIGYSFSDKDQFAVAINDNGKLIGFFCLHLRTGPEAYGYTNMNGSYALIRGLSIDERYSGKDYDVRCFDKIFEFINKEISEKVISLVLAIDEQNILAQRVYEEAGFKKKNNFFEEGRGKLIIMEKHNTNDSKIV